MNQRAHIRRSVDMFGTLTGEDFQDCQCRVADFCLGGVLLRIPDSTAMVGRLRSGEQVALRVRVQGARGERDITLPARVARVEADGVGLSFDQPNPSDLLALQNHVRAATDGQSAQRQTQRPAIDHQALLKRIVPLLNDELTDGIARLLPAARDALTAEAEKCFSNEDQHPWFAAEKTLQSQAENLAATFIGKARQPVEQLFLTGKLAEQESGSAGGGNSRLSLVDKDLFEDWLTLKVMASRAEGQFHEQLLPMQLRLDELLGISLSARSNPLHPVVICSAFGEALKALGFNQRIEKLLLGLFEREIVSGLKTLYDKVNDAMAAAGLLPDLDVGRYLSEHYGQTGAGESEKPSSAAGPEPEPGPEVQPQDRSAPAAPARPAGGASAGHTERRAAVTAEDMQGRPGAGQADAAVAPPPTSASRFAEQQRIANQAYSAVRRILSSRREAAAASRNVPTLDAPLAPQEVVSEALERLQRTDVKDDEAPLPERVQAAVNDSAGSESALDTEVEAATEVIHHLFEGIASNPALSERVKSAIHRLEVPFLRLLLQDEAFLSEDSHPARQMLNRIAHLGVRGHARQNDVEQAIDQYVENVLESFDNNINVFDETLENLDKLAGEQQKHYKRNLKRVTEAYEGRQKVIQARREVNEALERRIGGRQVPRALLALIDAGWRELLVQTLLRGGRDSREWHEYLGVLDRMQESSSRMPAQEELSGLLASIKQGLGHVDQTQTQNPALVGELRRLLSVKVRHDEGPPPMSEVPAGVLNEGEESTNETGLSETERRWRRRARRFEVGDWFELSDDEGEGQQIRLAWTNTEGTLFVFVNHQGMKIQEFSLADFATGLEQRTIVPIDNLDAPAVDRGLENMVQRVYNQMAHQATHDELTGLFNRREFERRLKQRLMSSDAVQATLVHLDIDQFKVVNNLGGPEAGDLMLQQLGQLIREVLPGSLIARLGGDEFAIWLEGIGEDACVRAVESLRDRIESHRFDLGGHNHAISVCFGLAHRQGDGDTPGNLMQAADKACQKAKESGRNRLQRYQPDDADMARREDVMVWASRLTEALDENRLQLRCQRIEPTEPTGAPPAYEVLIAMQDDQGKQVSPAEFVQAAERYNRMHAVDRWVIANVLQWMHAHAEAVRHIDHISINLSGHSLNDPTLMEFLFEQFHRYPVPRTRVCFEVTETTAITNLEDAADFIEAMKDMGCRFSLDDFGSGLASYGYLKHLPVNYIKIDGSFIKDAADDPADLALVRSINEMGHLMGKQTIAEYVENDAIRESMRSIGVDFVQGFGIEAPRPLSELVTSPAEPA
jgi:diguanylate cyclase (GGDEF)-like protein